MSDYKEKRNNIGSHFRLEGGRELSGEVTVQGSKNAGLPIMAASLLIKGRTLLHNLPDIRDTRQMQKLLPCKILPGENRHDLILDAAALRKCNLQKECVQSMRSSVLLIGPMLARTGSIRIGYPGGCVIGARPVNLHLMAMEKLGARVEYFPDEIHIRAGKLKGAVIRFPFPSVGATENAIMAAMGASGETVIMNAAREPEVAALCRFLIDAGAEIEGVGTSRLRICPGLLHDVEFQIPPDRIVAGTYLLAAAAAGGECRLKDVPAGELSCVCQVLRSMGVCLKQENCDMIIKAGRKLFPVPYIATDNYPGFPTDMQPMLAAVLAKADGDSEIHEQIFEDRFGYVTELNRMGADITLRDNHAMIHPVRGYTGQTVYARDLRGGAALMIAGLMAQGTTRIYGCSYIKRGYEDMVADIRLLGGTISEEIEDADV